MKLRPSNPTRQPGFTLVELMVVVVVVAVLAAIAWPSLQEAVQKSRRADGMSALARIMQAQERWRGSNPGYQNTLADLPGGAETASPDRHYTLSLVDGSVTASGYTVRATANSSSPQASDSRCRVLEVVVGDPLRPGTIIYRSLNSGGAVNADPDPCWVR